MKPFECPVCGAPSFTEYRVGSVTMLRCDGCHVTITPEHVSRLNDELFYAESYVMTPSSRASTRQLHYSRYPEYVRLLHEISSYRPPPGRWLDVGCGTGSFLDECRQIGYAVEGVEPSRTYANEAERMGLRIHRTIESIEGQYDVISMWHVLEHLQQPRATLQSLRTHIRPEGVLSIRVPNFMGKWSRMLKDRWVWFQPRQHSIHFGSESLSRVLNQSGFTIIAMHNQRPNSLLVRQAYTLADRVFHRYAGAHSETALQRFKRMLKDITAEELFVIAKPTS